MNQEQFKQMVKAASLFNEVARKTLTENGRLHAETLILSVGRMAGTMMFQSFAGNPKYADQPWQNIKPGTVVLSDAANEQGPKLIELMLLTLQQLGDTVTQNGLDQAYMNADRSQLNFREAIDRLAPFFCKIREVYGMSWTWAAFTGAVATGILVHDCREVLPVRAGAALGIYGFVEGTKTAPFPLPGQPAPAKSEPAEEKPEKPWYKFW